MLWLCLAKPATPSPHTNSLSMLYCGFCDLQTWIIYSEHHLRQARRTDLSLWRQSHNLHEAPGHGSSCILPGPCAIAKRQAYMIQTVSNETWMDIKWFVINYSTWFSFSSFLHFTDVLWNTGIDFGWSDLNCRPLTVPDRMSWGQQFRRWLLQTRSSVNLTLCRVSSPETVQKKNQWERPHILVSRSEVSTALIYITGNALHSLGRYVSLTTTAFKHFVPSYMSEGQFLYLWLSKLCIYFIRVTLYIYQ